MPTATEVRDTLVAAILEFLRSGDLLAVADVRAELEREIDFAGAGSILALKGRLVEDRGWDYYPPDRLAQRIHHLLAGRFLAADSELHGIEFLAQVARQPVVMVANHVSFADANVVEVLLHRAGAGAVADRLTAVVGPKVFTSRQRRFSSLCFGTIKVPQSVEVASGEAVLDPRAVARAARQAIEVAHARIASGDVLLLFPEGTRSRTGAMQPMLRPARMTVRFGPPLSAGALLEAAGRDRRAVMDAAGRAVAELLPRACRGAYA